MAGPPGASTDEVGGRASEEAQMHSVPRYMSFPEYLLASSVTCVLRLRDTPDLGGRW